MALATPATFPVPMVAAIAVINDSNALTSPSPELERIELMVCRIAKPILRIGMKPSPSIK
mgnify:CR=1 FL=1